jgi:hypothetical protein
MDKTKRKEPREGNTEDLHATELSHFEGGKF